MYSAPSVLSANASGRVRERWQGREERHAVDLLARYAWKGLRGTVLLKDLTRHGARIEGLEGLRQGDGLTLLLPDAPAVEVTVAWAIGRAAGLRFEQSIADEALGRIVRDFAAAPMTRLTPDALARQVAARASAAEPHRVRRPVAGA